MSWNRTRHATIAGLCLATSFLLTSCSPGIAYRMPTEGMLPTIGKDDLCIANPFAYSIEEIKRFDLVVFKPSKEQRERFNDDGLIYLMRVIGMPNEKLEIRDNAVYINDKLIDEPFEKIIDGSDFKGNFGPVTIPRDQFFFLGDNRPNSEDSRYWTEPTIPRSAVISKIVRIEKNFYKEL